ncbi:MAG: 6-carboxytetrahydropterin synthase [Methanobacterium sp.]|uniref:6-carboxytetrahydropterin synthase n=1 Tax=Methanobacterium sp. TaxID=2164 RepID=UPI003D65CB79|nr:6-carboxytetrahydropterin synthase [Methanobacterium sp.]
MKIEINGIHANLRFSSAHMIPLHESCGGIHGHSYIVDLVIEGERSGEFGFVVDFKKAKTIVRDMCSKLDHKVLIPCNSDVVEFTHKDNDSLEFTVGKKDYKLPLEDCCLLPLKSTSAEDLAEYFAEEIFKYLEKIYNNLSSVQICVNEGIGQGAYFQKSA